MSKAKPSLAVQRVYSYIRFSTPEQAMGDSERRQVTQAEGFAAKRGLSLDTDLRLADRGLSGYSGANRKKGVLGKFLELAKKGQIPAGSILLIEDIDRLSREEFFDAFETVRSLVTNGITIYTLLDNIEYTRESIASGLLWRLVGKMQNAHEESDKKSKRIRESRDKARALAREGKGVVTSRGPAWLTCVNGSFQAIPKAVASIQMLFDMKLKGLGKVRIAKTLNERAPWTPPPASKNGTRGGNGWKESYIQKILNNRAVIGEYQPYIGHGGGNRKPSGEPIQDYYPRIIKPEIFRAVQAKLTVNRGKGGQIGKVNNLLTSKTYCAYCGGKMIFEAKDNTEQWRYLVCDNGRRGVKCSPNRIKYTECEQVVIDNCRGLRPEQILPDQNEQTALCIALKQRVQATENELEDLATRSENLINQIEHTKSQAMRDRYESIVVTNDNRKQELMKQLETIRRELRSAEQSLESFTAWKSKMEGLWTSLAEKNNVELRLSVRNHLAELIEKIDVFAIGYQVTCDSDIQAIPLRKTVKGGKSQHDGRSCKGEDITDFLYSVAPPELCNSEKYRSFVSYVTKRRMSKEGRFLRIHFRSGATIDVVPKGSLASGLKLINNDGGRWQHTTPDLDRLWKEYEGSNPR